MAIEPSRRSYTERGAGLRDVDAARRARFLKAFAWALFPAVFLGGFLWMQFDGLAGPIAFFAILFGVAGWGLFWSEGIGGAAHMMLHPSATKRDIGNSRAGALLAQGDAQAAADAWEMTAAEHPQAPGPPAQVARVYRDHLGDPESAVRWFRKSVELAGMDASVRVTMRELVESARKVDGVGRSATPILARYAAHTEGTPEGEWAASELAAIKSAMAREG